MVRVWVAQVKLCDPLVTRGPYLSALEIRSLYIKRYINSPSLLYFTFTINEDVMLCYVPKDRCHVHDDVVAHVRRT